MYLSFSLPQCFQFTPGTSKTLTFPNGIQGGREEYGQRSQRSHVTAESDCSRLDMLPKLSPLALSSCNLLISTKQWLNVKLMKPLTVSTMRLMNDDNCFPTSVHEACMRTRRMPHATCQRPNVLRGGLPYAQ